MSRRDEIRARLDAATPGPWETYFTVHGDPSVLGPCRRDTSKPGVFPFDKIGDVSTAPEDYGRANADLIAHAPTDLRDLLAVAEAAEAIYKGADAFRPERSRSTHQDRHVGGRPCPPPHRRGVGMTAKPSDDLALLVRILDTLPADLQERIPAADVVRIIHATLREVRQ